MINKKMESLIRLLSDRECVDLTKLDNDQLLRICDFSKLTLEEVSTVNTIDTDTKIIPLLKNLIFHQTLPLTVDEFKSIDFNHLNEIVRRSCLGYMLLNNKSTELISVLLDQMGSVNYGIYSTLVKIEINPLIHCCRTGKFDLVRLLVEKYGADIEHMDCNDRTAIIISAQEGHVEITKYLYDLGARRKYKTAQFLHRIEYYATREIIDLINKWKHDSIKKLKSENQNLKLENDEMKRNYGIIKAENAFMKQCLIEFCPDKVTNFSV